MWLNKGPEGVGRKWHFDLENFKWACLPGGRTRWNTEPFFVVGGCCCVCLFASKLHHTSSSLCVCFFFYGKKGPSSSFFYMEKKLWQEQQGSKTMKAFCTHAFLLGPYVVRWKPFYIMKLHTWRYWRLQKPLVLLLHRSASSSSSFYTTVPTPFFYGLGLLSWRYYCRAAQLWITLGPPLTTLWCGKKSMSKEENYFCLPI